MQDPDSAGPAERKTQTAEAHRLDPAFKPEPRAHPLASKGDRTHLLTFERKARTVGPCARVLAPVRHSIALRPSP